MQANAYLALAQSEQSGWYYKARARAVHRLVKQFVSGDRPLDILDVGCGTGGTSHSFEQLGSVTGLEPNPAALELLQAKYPNLRAICGSADEIPRLLAPDSFDLATIMGVLYHRNVKDPVAALENVRQTLKPNGWIIWNEASYPFLRRKHDDFVQTERRFYPREMHRALADAGFDVVFGSHLLGWAFPIGVAMAIGYRINRWLSKIFKLPPTADPADDRHLPAPINAILGGMTFWEWYLSLKAVGIPFGVSYLVIARKRPDLTFSIGEMRKAA